MELTESLKGTYCRIFFDNFFTSPQVVYRLIKERKIYSCGTVRGHRRGLPKDMKSTKDLKKREIDSRYYDGMSIVKWLDAKSMIMLSTIDSGSPTNTVNVKRRQKGQGGKVDVKVPVMVQRYNKCMQGTDLIDQKTTMYAFNRKSPGKYYCRPFWDYVDMGLANSFIVYEKIVSTFPSGIKDNIAKTQKDFKEMVTVELIGNFCSRSAHFLTLNYTGANVDTKLIMSKATGGAKDVMRKRKETEKFI